MSYVIIGNSAAGISAAEVLRERGIKEEIVIISEEEHSPYYRFMVGKYLAGKVTSSEMVYRSREFYRDNNIIPFLGEKVKGIDTESKKVLFENREYITYEKLLIAAGAVPKRLMVDKTDYGPIFTLRTWQDAQNILDVVGKSEKALVVGGGVIGTTVTQALLSRGQKVSLLLTEPRLLYHALDERGSKLIEKMLINPDLEIYNEDRIIEVIHNPFDFKMVGVGLNSGQEVRCHFMVMDLGVEPNTQILRGAGVEPGRGIKVNEKMESVFPHVYAAGDVTESWNMVREAYTQTPNWSNASSQGRVAGINMAGGEEYHPGTLDIYTGELGLPYVSVGLVNPRQEGYGEDYQEKFREREEDLVYRKVVLKDGILCGLVFVGEIRGAEKAIKLIKERTLLTEKDIEELLRV
ncbi:MAG: NAD(P)/FAD-dependent oxidoreductase [Candidatus Syntrophonatronum acetioxidans]|uniref:NAD(P)/FAD-dependent oxidoreductase n=1 Tax=Candidatus Syntrophonatronum acetioxidans TaxID=1795816 RepID=A0A424YIQ1_9FIRM|nr:MAG: NAD(P)/FAD-dependent oxidoreductase [Candidatus Syntrophonatronum acetioxidans]